MDSNSQDKKIHSLPWQTAFLRRELGEPRMLQDTVQQISTVQRVPAWQLPFGESSS